MVTTTTKTIKYGKIEIPMNDRKSPYMPQHGGTFIDHGDIMKTMAIAIRDNLPVLLIGESGTGKTSAIRYLANQTGNGLRRVNLNGGTTADELVGRLLINDKGTYWVDGVLTEAMRKGEWIVLDEINAALPEVLFVLQSVLDDDGYLVLAEKDDKEIVIKHPNFRLFATCNPPEYAGTKEMNKALLSRFAICINADFPPPEKELEIIENRLGNAVASSEIAIKLVGLAGETRKAKELGNADYAINTRDILNTLQLSEFMEPIEALGLAFANKLDIADNKALRIMAKLHLPSKKRANANRKIVPNIESLIIGKTFVMKSDIHSAYYGLTDEKTLFDNLIDGDLGQVIANASRENGIKEDEFIIDATYYENINKISKQELDTAGLKIASAIQIIAGPNKGKQAILVHHKDLDQSDKIIKNLYEIN
jgi:MoxR-like ATPase